MDFCTRNLQQMSSMFHANCIKKEIDSGEDAAIYDDEKPLDLRICTKHLLNTPTKHEDNTFNGSENTSHTDQQSDISETFSTSTQNFNVILPSSNTSAKQSHVQDRKVPNFVVKLEAHTNRRSLKSHSCTRCNYSTNAEAKFREHLKAHEGRFICKNCNKACIKSSDLFRHWLSHGVRTTDGRYLCDTCDFATLQRNTLEDHMKCHYHLRRADQNKLCAVWSRCGMCDQRVPRSKIFEHKRTIHGRFFLKPRAGTLELQSEVVISGKENSSCLEQIKA